MEASVAFKRDWKCEEARRASAREARSWRMSEEGVGCVWFAFLEVERDEEFAGVDEGS